MATRVLSRVEGEKGGRERKEEGRELSRRESDRVKRKE